MSKAYKKKLIEVALPLEAINAASAREKSIRHGHPSTLHLWWARRPLAACRAVLFAQLVDDPSEYVDELLEDEKISKAAKKELTERTGLWKKRQAEPESPAANTPKPTLEDCAADVERKRLFKIIEDLVKWENSTNEEILERARAEIQRSCNGELPPVYDPFSGGCSIPLEAQRLGLPAYGSDLNPVAVMIGKAMIEIPPKFKDRPPIHPGTKERNHYRNAEGLAEDVKYYGEWMREKAFERIGHLYPQVDMPSEYGGGKATVIAWIWARTVASPDPSLKGAHVPLTNTYILSKKKGREAIAQTVVDRMAGSYRFAIKTEGITKEDMETARFGSRSGRAEDFLCAISGAPITREYIRQEGKAGRLGTRLISVVADGRRGRDYIEPSDVLVKPLLEAAKYSCVEGSRATFLSGSTPTRAMITGGVCSAYGFTTWGSLYTDRQLIALNTLSKLVDESRKEIISQFGTRKSESDKAQAYADAISLYLGLCVGRMANRASSLCFWDQTGENVQQVFARQAIPMTWDFVEGNIFSTSTGNFMGQVGYLVRAVEKLPASSSSMVIQEDAREVDYQPNGVLNTDPPYYDNINYSILSDYFYAWLRHSLRATLPELTSSLQTPKSSELIASAFRHGGRRQADEYFLEGMKIVFSRAANEISDEFPAAIYYAFKANEASNEGIFSPGWATFIQATIDAGFSIHGTWPIRSEYTGNLKKNVNALANSVVLVCRKREALAEVITRAEFIRALKRELPSAISELQAANIAPADMPQSAIGPGMGVFSRYKAVLEADDSPMTVKTALQLINHQLDDYIGGIVGEFDADTRFAITWFEQNGMKAGEYGTANNIATARGISVESAKHAGIVESSAGKVRILMRDDLDPDWEPDTDSHHTVWECLQHLVRQHEQDGISDGTALLLKKIGDKADAVKDLAYCLYDISANKRQDAKEATAYNALIADWTELTQEAATISDTRGDGQARMDF